MAVDEQELALFADDIGQLVVSVGLINMDLSY